MRIFEKLVLLLRFSKKLSFFYLLAAPMTLLGSGGRKRPFSPATLAVEIRIPSSHSGGKEVKFDIFCSQGNSTMISASVRVPIERSSVEDQREMLLVVAHEEERPLKQGCW